MGVMICAALLLTAWVAFVFSKHIQTEGSRRVCGGPARSEHHRWYR